MSSGSGSLSRYILVRLLLIIPMMWVLLTMVFFLLRVAPGDPVSAALGGRLSEEALDVRREALGLDRPLFVQYLEYLGQVARFNFGTTVSRRPRGHRRDPRPGRCHAHPDDRRVPLRPAGRASARADGGPLPRHRGRRGHPHLRRRHLRRPDLLGRHHAGRCWSSSCSPAGRPRESPRRSRSSGPAPDPHPAGRLGAGGRPQTRSTTCSSTTCSRASHSGCCCAG